MSSRSLRILARSSLHPSALVLAAVSIVFALSCAAIGFSRGGANELHTLFQNPGPVADLAIAQMIATAALAFLAFLGSRTERGWRRLGNPWLLCSLGFALFALDQSWNWLPGARAQDLHFEIGLLIGDHTPVSSPLFFDSASDPVVVAYLGVGVSVALLHRRELLIHPDVRWHFIVGIGLAALMVAIDSFLPQTPLVKVIEDVFKLCSGSFFIAALLIRFQISRVERTAPAAPLPAETIREASVQPIASARDGGYGPRSEPKPDLGVV